jgi:hypothetical protein
MIYSSDSDVVTRPSRGQGGPKTVITAAATAKPPQRHDGSRPALRYSLNVDAPET